MSTIPIDDKLVIGPDRANIDARYKASNNRPYTSVAAAEAAINLVIGNVGLTVLVADENDPDYPKAKEYWVQPKGTTPETYGLVEKGAGTTDYADLDNKPTISDGGQGIPLLGNVKVTATAATSGQTTGVAVTAENGGITMAFTLEKGAPGANGAEGQQGPQGASGKSAFDVWKETTGRTNATEAEYIEDLQTKVAKWIPIAYEALSPAPTIGDTVTFSTAPSNPIEGAIVLMPNGSPATATMMFAVSSDGQTPATYTYTYIGDLSVDTTGLLGSSDVDSTNLNNPTSSQVAKATDVMQLAAKLEGVTATEDKVQLGTKENGAINGSTGVVLSNGQRYEIALPDGVKRVRFLAAEASSSSYPYGFAFYDDAETPNVLKCELYRINGDSSTRKHYEIISEVPNGAKTFKFSLSSLNTDIAYCYLQSGESVKDMVDTFKNDLYGYSDDSVVSETDYKNDITASITLSIGKDDNNILCVKRSNTALYRAGKITDAHFDEIKEEFAKLHVDGYYVSGTSRTGSLIFTKKNLSELEPGTYYYQDLKDAGYLCDEDTETDFIHRFNGKGTPSGANGYDYEIPKDAKNAYFQYNDVISGTNVNLYPISIVPFSEKHAGKLDNLPTGGTVEVIDNLNSEDPESALSAKQGKVIGGELEKQYKVKQIVFYKKPTYGITLTGNNWGSDTTYAHAIVPVKTGEIYKIENYGSNDNIRYAFLTSDECEAGAAMPLVDGTSIKTVNAGEIETFTIPEGCTYITFMCNKPTGTGQYYSRLYKVLHISDKEITPFDEDYIEAYTLGMPINAVDYHELWDDLVDKGIVQRSEATYMSYDSETQKYPLYTYHIRCHRDWMGYGNNSQYRVGQNTDFTNPLYRRKKVMITAGIHGCERLTPNTFLKWVKKHINDDIFAEFDFVIIPLCNPYGYSNTLVTSGGNVADFSKINADTFPSGYSIIENTDTKNRGLRRTYGWIDINRDFYDTGGFQTEEAQYIRDVWIAEQPDMVIDFHQDLNSGDANKKCGFANVGSNPGLTSEEFLEMKRKLYTLIDKAGYATDKYVNMYFDAASKKQQTFCWNGANPNAAPSTDPPTQGVWKAFATGSSKINTLYRDHLSRYAFTFETDIYCNQLSGSTITPNNGIAKMFGYIFMSNFLKYILDIFKLDEPRLDTPTEESSDDEDEGEE